MLPICCLSVIHIIGGYNNLVFNIHQSATDVYDSDSMEKSIEYWDCPTAPGLIY